MKTLYVISYDIVNDKKRSKIAKLLEGYGRRVQYSVFECVLSKSDFAKLYAKLLQIDVDSHTDSIYIYMICLNCEKKIITIGRKVVNVETKDDAIIIL